MGMRARLGLLECRYRLGRVRPSLSLAGVRLETDIGIRNTTAVRIRLPETRFDLHLSGIRIGGIVMEARTLESGGTIRLPVQAGLSGGPAVRAILASIRNKGLAPRLTGSILLPLWFGRLRVYILRI